jgi:hypothetical protein
VRRSARAVTDSPISVSSATAWIAVPITSGRWWAGGTGERGEEGMPRGWGGWRSVSLRALLRAGRLGAGFALCAAFGLAAETAVGRARLAGLEAVLTGELSVAGGVWLSSGFTGRLVLRRCGRVRGRDPSSSDGRSSGIGSAVFADVAAPSAQA